MLPLGKHPMTPRSTSVVVDSHDLGNRATFPGRKGGGILAGTPIREDVARGLK